MTYIVQRQDRFYVVDYDGLDPLTGKERRGPVRRHSVLCMAGTQQGGAGRRAGIEGFFDGRALDTASRHPKEDP